MSCTEKVSCDVHWKYSSKLTSVIVDKDIGCATLQLVRGNGLFDGSDSRLNDTTETFFVDGHLDRHMRQWSVCVTVQPTRCLSRVELGVRLHVSDRTDQLSNVTNDGLEEELIRLVGYCQ
jgi:hypothetical protein